MNSNRNKNIHFKKGRVFMVYLWLILFVAAVLIEAATTALISIWFAVGSIAALAAAAFGAPVWLQLIVFAVFAIVMLIFTRPMLKKLFPKKFTPTNTELSIGKSAVVIEDINNSLGTGRVRLNGVDWMAVSANDRIIEKDTVVTVKEINGAKLTVE